MKKILFLSFPDKNKCHTGGAKVDIKFQEFLEKFDNIETDNKTFEEVGFVGRRSINKSKLIHSFSQYDIVLFDEAEITRFAYKINYIKKNSNIKIYTILHHYLFLQYSGMKNLFMHILEPYLLNRIDGILFPGKYPYDLALQKRILTPDKLFHIGIGTDDKRLIERDSDDNLNVLFIGHIMRRKGVHYLLKAINELKIKNNINLDTTIIGDCQRDPSYTRELQQYITKNNLENYVRLTGRISDTEKDLIFKKSDIFVFPSLCEGFGIVILEAMKHGMPSIVFNNTSLPYMVNDDYDGYIVRNKDWHAIYKKLLYLYNNRTDYQRLSDGAKKTFLNSITWDEVEENLRKWADK